MKTRYFFAVIFAFMMLTGCKNRFEEYEPYSTFDERMMAADQGGPMLPMDSTNDTYYQYGFGEMNGVGNVQSNSRPTRSAPVRRAQVRSSSAGAARNYNSDSGNTEVPFTDTRGPAQKKSVNVGALPSS